MRRSAFLFGAAALAGGCAHSTSGAHFRDLSANGEPLRSDFNRDADRVRLLLLVSPT